MGIWAAEPVPLLVLCCRGCWFRGRSLAVYDL